MKPYLFEKTIVFLWKEISTGYREASELGVVSLPLTMYALFYKQHFYKQRQAEIGKKLSKC